MQTYYRDPEVQVTSDDIRMNGRAFRAADIERIWHRRGRPDWRLVAGRGGLGLAMLSPIVVGLLGIVLAVLLRASASVTIALVGGGVLVGLATVPVADLLLERVDRSYDRGSRVREVWARVRGRDVLLLRTPDARRFGLIYRALQHALDGTPTHRQPRR